MATDAHGSDLCAPTKESQSSSTSLQSIHNSSDRHHLKRRPRRALSLFHPRISPRTSPPPGWKTSAFAIPPPDKPLSGVRPPRISPLLGPDEPLIRMGAGGLIRAGRPLLGSSLSGGILGVFLLFSGVSLRNVAITDSVAAGGGGEWTPLVSVWSGPGQSRPPKGSTDIGHRGCPGCRV